MAMNHQYIWRFDAMAPETELARKHIVEALLQAYQDKVHKVVFGASCRSGFHWTLEGRLFGIAMPQDLDASEVKRRLVALAGLDNSTKFPKRTELALDFPNAGLFEESSVARMRWVVSMTTAEAPITLERGQ